jgi:hypothetical protein
VEAGFDLDLDRLAALASRDDPKEYGSYLYDAVFRHSSRDSVQGRLHHRFAALLRRVEDEDARGLRVRLLIANTVPQLHGLVWECLLDAQERLYLSANRRLALYRDLEVDQRIERAIRVTPSVLVAVVCPTSGLGGLDLQSFDVADEQERLRVLLNPFGRRLFYTILPADALAGRSTLDQLGAALEEGQFQVLHLSCHGLIRNEKAWLVLAKEDGRAHLVDEERFRDLFMDLPAVRLVLVDACRSAQASQAQAFAGLVPQLMAHVPAAIGMQRPWYTGMADWYFTEAFYKSLCHHGYVDRALQQARYRLRHWNPERWEWSTPVLFLRLEDGRLFRPEPAAAPGPHSEPPAAASRPGGTAIRIGAGSELKGVDFDGEFTGGVHYTGPEPPQEIVAIPPGVAVDIGEGVRVEDARYRGRFAAGGIIYHDLQSQASQPFGPDQQRAALEARIRYLEERLEKLKAEAGVVDKGLFPEETPEEVQRQAELDDLREAIADHATCLADDDLF